jgi:hypothetical protein
MMKRSSWEAGEAGLASSSHRWPTQSKLAKMSRAMSPYTSYGSIRVTMKLEMHDPGGGGSHDEGSLEERVHRIPPENRTCTWRGIILRGVFNVSFQGGVLTM